MRKEIFTNKAKIIHGDKYDYSLVIDSNRKTKIKIICSIHGEFEQSIDNHLMGKGCNKCGGSIALDFNRFIEKAKLIHGDKYDYSKVKYINNKVKVAITCPIHGEFEQTPNSHLNGRGCNKCANKQRQNYKKLGVDGFIKKANLIHNNKYEYKINDYLGSDSYLKIICPIHGEFEQRILNHLYQKNGCPKCKESKGETQIAEWLEANNIKYIRQYRFPDCRNIKPLPFDFYLPEINMCIEYQGEQHFRPIKRFGGEEKFKTIVVRDEIKRNYCFNNSINLLNIKYNENIINKLSTSVSGDALKTRMKSGDIPLS